MSAKIAIVIPCYQATLDAPRRALASFKRREVAD